MTDDDLHLRDIRDSIRWVRSYAEVGREEFMRSRLHQSAAIREFQIIGEATKKLSDELKRAYPNIPWRRIAGSRDILVHDYANVRLVRVWNIMARDLPLLEQQIEVILRDRGTEVSE